MKITLRNNLKVEERDDLVFIGFKNNELDFELYLTEKEKRILRGCLHYEGQNNEDKKPVLFEENMVLDLAYLLPSFIEHQLNEHC